MAKINDIRFLARETAKEVSGSPRDWMGYLDTASRLYRYPFSDTLLIHAQRPDATACAELEVWNEKMPDVPLYSDEYYDFYSPKLKGWESTAVWEWSRAVLDAWVVE